MRRIPGLPDPQRLKDYRIWDSYFTPSYADSGTDGSSKLLADIDRAMPAIQAGQFEKLCYFPHVGIGTTTDKTFEELVGKDPSVVSKAIDRWPDLLMGMIQVNSNRVRDSLDALNRWLRDGPMVGVYFPGSGPGSLVCSHRNCHTIVERVEQLRGVIMQHTWYVTGGRTHPGTSTPAELAALARNFPEQKFVCAHAGGEWEKGLRAIRGVPNVLVETSGFDATAGFIEAAVREIGAARIVFGSHLPSRSLGTELTKITTAAISEEDKKRILGENFRRLLAAVRSP